MLKRIQVLEDTPLTSDHPIKKNDKLNISQHLVRVTTDDYNKIKFFCPKRVSKFGNYLIINHPLNKDISHGKQMIKITPHSITISSHSEKIDCNKLSFIIHDISKLKTAIDDYRANKYSCNEILIENSNQTDELIIVLRSEISISYNFISLEKLNEIYDKLCKNDSIFD